MSKFLLNYLLIIFLFFSFSKTTIAGDWSEWQEISISSIPLEYEGIYEILKSPKISSWLSEANLQGGKARNYYIDIASSAGFARIDYLKFPPAWVISGSENDRKYMISKVEFLLNIENKNNPIKNISKKNIERYRDVNNTVVPHIYFSYNDKNCIIANKGYHKRETGYVQSVEDDETLSILFCKNSGTINEVSAIKIINSILVK